LPPGCVVCNAPEATRKQITARKFNLPLPEIALIASPLLLIMCLVSSTTKFNAGLCAEHWGAFRKRFTAIHSDRRYLWVAGINAEYLQKLPDIAAPNG
jgi:hypothetical protein